MVRLSTRNYDKMALIDQLKMAGFEEAIAYIIAERVEQRKSKRVDAGYGAPRSHKAGSRTTGEFTCGAGQFQNRHAKHYR